MLQVEFPAQECCVLVPRTLLARIGVLSDVPPECDSLEMRLPGVTAELLSALCQLLAQSVAPLHLANTHSLWWLCALALAHARLEAELALGALLEQAVGEALCAATVDELIETARTGDQAQWPGEGDDWHLGAQHRAVRDTLYCTSLRLKYCALQALMPRDLATRCLARVRLPATSLEELAQTLDLSGYMTRVVHDLVLQRDDLHQLLYVVCSNPVLAVVNGAAYVGTEREALSDARLLKVLLREADAPLQKRVKRGELSKLQKDAAMVRHFLGWGVTRAGHVIYLYYRGPSSRTQGDLARVEHWRPLPLDALRFFHARLGKELGALWRGLCSSDVVEHADGSHNPALDVRYLAHRWAKRNPAGLAQVRDNAALLNGLQQIK
jgi:hypothetical protein